MVRMAQTSGEPKDRPAVIVSREQSLSGLPEVIVVPFSKSFRLPPPAGVSCSAGDGGLPHDSIALCPLVKAVPKHRFMERLGVLPDSLFAEILSGVGHAIDLAEASG